MLACGRGNSGDFIVFGGNMHDYFHLSSCFCGVVLLTQRGWATDPLNGARGLCESMSGRKWERRNIIMGDGTGRLYEFSITTLKNEEKLILLNSSSNRWNRKRIIHYKNMELMKCKWMSKSKEYIHYYDCTFLQCRIVLEANRSANRVKQELWDLQIYRRNQSSFGGLSEALVIFFFLSLRLNWDRSYSSA